MNTVANLLIKTCIILYPLYACSMLREININDIGPSLSERMTLLKDRALEPKNINRIKYHSACELGYIANGLLIYFSFDQGQQFMPAGAPQEVIHSPIINYHNGTISHLGQCYYYHRVNELNATGEAVWYASNFFLLPVFNEPQFLAGLLGGCMTFVMHTSVVSKFRELFCKK